MAPLGGLFATQRHLRVETERGLCDRYAGDVRFGGPLTPTSAARSWSWASAAGMVARERVAGMVARERAVSGSVAEIPGGENWLSG